MSDWLLWNYVYMLYEVWLVNWMIIFCLELLFGICVILYIKVKRIESRLLELKGEQK